MKRRIDRRDALRYAVLGTAGIGMSSILATRAMASAAAGVAGGDAEKKMLLIFLRGANDAMNTVPPIGPLAQSATVPFDDVEGKYRTLRPRIGLYPSNSTASGVVYKTLPIAGPGGGAQGFAEMNPALKKLAPILAAGEFAFLHRIGHLGMSLSHFSAQRFWETGRPMNIYTGAGQELVQTNYHEGWVANWAGTEGGGYLAASVSPDHQAAFDSPVDDDVQAHLRRIYASGNASDYSFKEDPSMPRPTHEQQLLTALANQAKTGTGDPPLIGPADNRARKLMDLARSSETSNESLVANPYSTPIPYPTAGAGQPTKPEDLPPASWVTEFGDTMRNAVAALVQSDVRVVGVEIGGWDTHSDQVDPSRPDHALGRQQGLLATLADALHAVWKDLKRDGVTQNVLTMVTSEFSRTNTDTQSNGTDHGFGSLMMVMGTSVRPTRQVHNCERSSVAHFDFNADTLGDGAIWYPGLPPDKYTIHRTDYRAVYEEALMKHMGFTQSIDLVFPGFTQDRSTYTGLGAGAFMQQLNCFQ